MKLSEINSAKKFNFSCIYKWTNLVDGKVYIGETINLYMRMAKYREGFFNKEMKAAVEKYGIDNFEVEIIEKDVPEEYLIDLERYWISYYDSTNKLKGYNIAEYGNRLIGCPAWNKGVSVPHNIREKISKGLKEYYSVHEVWNKGIPATEEAKQKNRESNSGEKNGMYGRTHSKETRKKISNSLKGRKISLEHKEKLSRKIICIETGKIYSSITEAAKEMNCNHTTIWRVVAGKNKTAKGFHWEYVN